MKMKIRTDLDKMERELAKESFHYKVVHAIKHAYIAHMKKHKAKGTWDDLKQLRFDGTMDILEACSDLTLKDISDMCFYIDVRLEFAMVDKREPTRAFLDTGTTENYSRLGYSY